MLNSTEHEIYRGIRGGGLVPMKNHKNIGFDSITDLDPLKNQKSYGASIQCWAIIGTPVKPIENKQSIIHPIYKHCVSFVSLQIVKVFYAKVHLSRDGIETKHFDGKLYYVKNDTGVTVPPGATNATSVVVVPLPTSASGNTTVKANGTGKS